MNLKSTFVAIAATAALSAIVLPTASQACMFSKQGGVTDSAPSSSPVIDSVITQSNFSDLGKLGIVGAGFAVLSGLLGGGVLLKRRLDRKSEPLIQEVQIQDIQADLPEQMPEPGFDALQLASHQSAASQFAIEVPKEALESSRTVEEPELTSVR